MTLFSHIIGMVLVTSILPEVMVEARPPCVKAKGSLQDSYGIPDVKANWTILNNRLINAKITLNETRDKATELLEIQRNKCGTSLMYSRETFRDLYGGKGFRDLYPTRKIRKVVRRERKQWRALGEIRYLLSENLRYSQMVEHFGDFDEVRSLSFNVTSSLMELGFLEDLLNVSYSNSEICQNGAQAKEVSVTRLSETDKCNLTFLALMDIECSLLDIYHSLDSCRIVKRRTRRSADRKGKGKKAKKGRRGRKCSKKSKKCRRRQRQRQRKSDKGKNNHVLQLKCKTMRRQHCRDVVPKLTLKRVLKKMLRSKSRRG